MKINHKFASFLGWYGAFAIVLAYALVSFNVIPSKGWIFQLLNLTGAIGLIIISTIKGVKQTLVLNVFWALIAIIAIAGLINK